MLCKSVLNWEISLFLENPEIFYIAICLSDFLPFEKICGKIDLSV